MQCCDDPKFELVEDLGHVESVDWDLGTCASCGSYVLRQWSEYAPLRTYDDKLTAEKGAQFRDSQGRDRVILLKRWYADH